MIYEGGFPNRYYRFCCKVLKEYHILDYVVIGVRRAESTRRAARYKEPEQCYVYSKNVRERQYFPILDWSDSDVAEFIAKRGIKCHSLYYDKTGKFHVERRLGCMCCPLASIKKRIKQFKEYPGMVKYYLRAGQKYLDKHPESKTAKTTQNVYEWFVRDVFFEREYKWTEVKNSMFGAPDCKKFLEDYFKIKL